jgi:hypothetical protein
MVAAENMGNTIFALKTVSFCYEYLLQHDLELLGEVLNW